MLHNIVFLLFSMSCVANAHIEKHSSSCRSSPVKSLTREDRCYQNTLPQDRFLEQFQQESLQKVEALSQDKEFQDAVAEFQSLRPKSSALPSISKDEPQGELYIFVSFSMGEKALLNLAHEAKQLGATLVLRGFKEGSYRKTAHSLMKIIQETGIGVLVDPELYTLFDIQAVPTFVLAKPFQLLAQERTQTPLHDKLQGHVSVGYTLEQFAQEGDLKEAADHLLQEGITP